MNRQTDLKTITFFPNHQFGPAATSRTGFFSDLRTQCEICGLAYDPKKDGFVFSLHFIKAQTDRHHKLILARRTETDYRKKNNLTEITKAAGKAA